MKRDFMGEPKQLEDYSKKLYLEFKQNSKAVINEVKGQMDEALREVINRRIADDLESRVRRFDPLIKSFQILLDLSE